MNNKLTLSLFVVLLLLQCMVYVLSREISLKDLKKLTKPVKQSCYTYDGVGVNKKHPTWGSTGEPFPRLTKAAYTDGIKVPPRQKYSAREISNVFCKQEKCDDSNKYGLSSMFYAFAQFIDHDIDSIGTGINTESFPIPIPPGDRFTTPTMPFTRANFASEKQIFIGQPLNQVNQITGYLDCSQIYGSDPIKGRALRLLKGGLLKYDEKFGLEFLPSAFPHTNGLFFSGGRNQSIVAGDDRVTEALPITSIQTLFLREHNRLARLLAKRFNVCKSDAKSPKYDEWLYQTARAINCAQIQSITYKEYVPALIGKSHSFNPKKVKFNPDVQVTPSTEFATVAYRFGHSLVSCFLKRIDENGIEKERVEFKDAFNGFNRFKNSKEELDLILRGLCKHAQQNLDEKVADGLRDFLFGPNVRFDLAAFNLQRSRDCGIASFNDLRSQLGLKKLTATEISNSNSELKQKLVQYYGEELSDLDPWLGILMEPKSRDSMLGKLGTKIVKDQFLKLIKGDPCFYTHRKESWVKQLRKSIERVTLSDIIVANTGIKRGDKALGSSAFKSKN
ncbi:peroxidase [Naegleria gruberi]|uniref:Peroxidase n=1 Tax=Naegleria gruberi TaxID=5762 RepID=D2VNW8_NAEGR|nr:peroxidase [Naegleria gruberi]EFC41564.1 peroxidase [Naegleria gruberi]|eukprot:XP_002674308.1 peroxidase [Naegleria gruberi]